MTTNFPSSVDAFTNPTSNDTLDNPPHDQQHADINDAMEAVQTSLLDGSPLRIDDANNRVGVNDATPSYTLDVNGDINTTGALRTDGRKTGLVLMGDDDLTNNTSRDLRNIFTTEFDDYLLFFSDLTGTTQNFVYFNMFINGTSNLVQGASDYQRYRLYGQSSVGTQQDSGSSGRLSAYGSKPGSFIARFSSPMLSKNTIVSSQGLYSDNTYYGNFEFQHTVVTTTDQCDGIRIGATSGYISGRLEVYGCPK